MAEFPAISLWQPWASLPFVLRPTDGTQVKKHETRNRPAPPKYVGRRIALHAARQPIVARNLPPALQELCSRHFGEDYVHTLPRGEFIGTLLLESSAMMGPDGARPADGDDRLCGWWERGRWAWRMSHPLLLPEPIIASGHQGWWTVELPIAPLQPPELEIELGHHGPKARDFR
jgi:hypothetical protein